MNKKKVYRLNEVAEMMGLTPKRALALLERHGVQEIPRRSIEPGGGDPRCYTLDEIVKKMAWANKDLEDYTTSDLAYIAKIARTMRDLKDQFDSVVHYVEELEERLERLETRCKVQGR